MSAAGRSGGRDGGGNRFAPLAEQGRGGGGTAQGPAAADWRAVVRVDMQSERPAWPATCYGHLRGQARPSSRAARSGTHSGVPLAAWHPCARMREEGQSVACMSSVNCKQAGQGMAEGQSF